MFESKRLVYRTMDETDFDLFYELYSDEKVMKYAYLDRVSSLDVANKFFKNILLDQTTQDKGTQYVAILKDANVSIGLVDYDVILNHEKGGIFEIGYFIKPKFWGQGFGTESGKALINYVFNRFNIHKVVASCNANNKKSESVMINLGMTKEGLLRQVRYKDNHWVDEIKYGLLKEEWISKQIEEAIALSAN